MPENMFDAIVAGAGIWGYTIARRLAEAGRKVLVPIMVILAIAESTPRYGYILKIFGPMLIAILADILLCNHHTIPTILGKTVTATA